MQNRWKGRVAVFGPCTGTGSWSSWQSEEKGLYGVIVCAIWGLGSVPRSIPLCMSLQQISQEEKRGRPQTGLKDQVLPPQLVLHSVKWVCGCVWSQEDGEEGLVCVTAP